MSDTATEQLGVEFNVSGVTQGQKGFATLRREALVTAKVINQAMSSSRGRNRGMLNPPMRVSDIIGTAVVAASPSNAGAVSSSVSGNRLKIDITLKGVSRAVAMAGESGAGTRASRYSERSRQAPAELRSRVSGPHQRRAHLLNEIENARLAGDADWLADAERAYERNEKVLNPKAKTSKPYVPNGPRQQLARLWESMHHSLSTGNFAAYDDTKEQYDSLLKKLNTPKKQPQSKIMQAIMTSRYGLGNASPLVGRTLAALGVEGNPMVVAAGAAATALYEMAKSAAEATNSFTRMSTELGSSAATTSQLSGIGSALGMSREQTASIAGRIQESITGSPMGRAAGLRLGVYNLPGMFGNQDYGAQALTVIKNLQKQNPNDRLAIARQLGIADVLPLLNVSSRQMAANKRTSDIQGQLMTPEQAGRAADFQAATSRVQMAMENLLNALSPSVMSKLTDLFTGLGNLLDDITTWVMQHQGMINFVVNAADLIGTSAIPGSLLMAGQSSSSADLARALDKNSKITEANTQAMGTFGAPITRGMPYGEGMNGQFLADGRREGATLNLSAI